MQNILMGYNQELAVEYGLDIIDLAILQWFERFKNKECVSEEGKDFYWLNYQTLIDDLPALGIKSKDRIYRRLKKMEKCGLLIHKHLTSKGNKKGRFSFYAFGEKYPSFKVDKNTKEQKQVQDQPCTINEEPEQVVADEPINKVEIGSKLNSLVEGLKQAIKSNIHKEISQKMEALREMLYTGQIRQEQFNKIIEPLRCL